MVLDRACSRCDPAVSDDVRAGATERDAGRCHLAVDERGRPPGRGERVEQADAHVARRPGNQEAGRSPVARERNDGESRYGKTAEQDGGACSGSSARSLS